MSNFREEQRRDDERRHREKLERAAEQAADEAKRQRELGERALELQRQHQERLELESDWHDAQAAKADKEKRAKKYEAYKINFAESVECGKKAAALSPGMRAKIASEYCGMAARYYSLESTADAYLHPNKRGYSRRDCRLALEDLADLKQEYGFDVSGAVKSLSELAALMDADDDKFKSLGIELNSWKASPGGGRTAEIEHFMSHMPASLFKIETDQTYLKYRWAKYSCRIDHLPRYIARSLKGDRMGLSGIVSFGGDGAVTLTHKPLTSADNEKIDEDRKAADLRLITGNQQDSESGGRLIITLVIAFIFFHILKSLFG